MNRLLLLGLGIALAACGTPQQQCISQSTQDLRIVDSFIAETEANLARGYALAQDVTSVPRLVDCTPEPTDKHPNPRQRNCLVNEAQPVTRPVAIDLDAEAAKLASLKAKRAQLAAQAQPAILACQRTYPE